MFRQCFHEKKIKKRYHRHLDRVSVFGSVLTDVPPLRQGVMHVVKKIISHKSCALLFILGVSSVTVYHGSLWRFNAGTESEKLARTDLPQGLCHKVSSKREP